MRDANAHTYSSAMTASAAEDAASRNNSLHYGKRHSSRRAYPDNADGGEDSSSSVMSTSSLLLNRPISLGNLLSTSASSTLSPSYATSVAGTHGVPPTSSTAVGASLPSFANTANHAYQQPHYPSSSSLSASSSSAAQNRGSRVLRSPTGSVRSTTSTTTSSTTANHSIPPAAVTASANKVLLPANQHGVRTRVNILPASRFARPGSRDNLSSAGVSRPSSTFSTDSAGGPNGLAEKKRRQSNLSLLSSSQSTLHHPASSSGSSGDMLGWARRNVSESSASASSFSGAPHRTAPPAPIQSSDARSVSTGGYTFPARSNTDSSIASYNVHPSFDSIHTGSSGTDASSSGPQTPLTNHPTGSSSLAFRHAPTFSHSSLASSSSANHSPSFGMHSSAYTTPGSSSSKPSPHSASSSASGSNSFSTTTRAGIPKALLPGGYDFSPTPSNATAQTLVSRETYETAPMGNQSSDSSFDARASPRPSPQSYGSNVMQRPAQHLQHTDPPRDVDFARDRSLSVPRTVSEVGSLSGRTSEAGDERLLTHFSKFGGSSLSVNEQQHGSGYDSPISGRSKSPSFSNILPPTLTRSGQATQLNLRPRTGTGASSSSAGSASFRLPSRDSPEREEDDEYVAAQISPIPPKLDMDFGNFSSFSLDLDFDTSFSGSSAIAGMSTRERSLPDKVSKGETGLGTDGANWTGRLSPKLSLGLGGGLGLGNLGIKKEAPAAGVDKHAEGYSTSTITAKGPSRKDSNTGLADLGLGLGFPSSSRLSEVRAQRDISEGVVQPLSQRVEASLVDNDDQPLAHLLPGAGRARSNTSSVLLTASTARQSDADTTPKASLSPPAALVSTSVLQQQQQQNPAFTRSTSSLSSHTRLKEHDRSDTPSSSGSGRFSRRTSSLLNPVGVVDDKTESESKRTTLSSSDAGTSHLLQSSKSATLQPGQPYSTNFNSARLSINKTLPPVPPQLGQDVDVEHARKARPADLYIQQNDRSVSGSAMQQQGELRDQNLQRESRRTASEGGVLHRPVLDRTRTDSTTSAMSSLSAGASSDSRQPPRPTDSHPSSVHTRSRSSTLDRQLPLTSEDLRGPHGSSITSNFSKLEAVDLGVATARHTREPTQLRPQVKLQKDRHPNGELVTKDPATDALLASVSDKLLSWAGRHPSRLIVSSPPSLSAPRSPLETGDMSQDSGLGDFSDAADGSADASFDVATTSVISAKVLSAGQVGKAAPVRVSTATLVNKQLETAKHAEEDETQECASISHAPTSISSSSLTSTKPPPSKAPTQASADGVLSDQNVPGSEPTDIKKADRVNPLSLKLEPVMPLRIHSKKPSTASAKKPAGPRQTIGELPFSSAWSDLEQSLTDFRTGLGAAASDRAQHIQTGFLPKFKQEELYALVNGGKLAKRQRDLLFDWIEAMFEDLAGVPANRGACLDGIASIVESRLMSYFFFDDDTAAKTRMEKTLAGLLAWAVEKLNGKAIFANTLGFAGKMLAAAFWNLDGVALKLLRLLPAVKRQHMKRIITEAGISQCLGKFPPHLQSLSYDGNLAAYCALFPPVRAVPNGDNLLYSAKFDKPLKMLSIEGKQESGGTVTVEMSGNWLIRWTATDSDLPFAFMRAYHRQLSNYLPLFEEGGEPFKTAQLIKAPGYLFVSATLLEVCDALIHRNLRSVTTMAPSNTGINANESANLAAGQKPKALEVVSKRVVQTMFEVTGGPLQAGSIQTSPAAFASAALRNNFGCALRTWLAAVAKRTSMWDTRGIFALLDLIEGLVYNVCAPPMEEGTEDDEDEDWRPSEVGLALFDTTFILSFIKTILSKADNTTCLLRTISFLYTEFQTFTLRAADRDELCEGILLDGEIFNRLFLYYNVGVRGYFLRLLVYRLARLGNPDDHKGQVVCDMRIYAILRLFEARLEKIRKRHDELDPLDDYSDEEDDYFRPRPKRSTISSTWGVHDKPWAMELRALRESSELSEEERETAVKEQNTHVEAIKEPAEAILSPPILLTPPASTSSLTLPKQGKKLTAAKKVAGGWWNTLKNRKGSGEKKKSGHEDLLQPFYDSEPTSNGPPVPPPLTRGSSLPNVHLTSEPLDISPFPAVVKECSASSAASASDAAASPSLHALVDKDNMQASVAETKPSDGLRVDVPSARSRKVSTSTKKSIRRAASTAASPRSRRSSMYSFDLDVDTPRSDAFDFPISPASAMSPNSPNVASGLSISPIAFNALMDGALSFSAGEDGTLTTASSPGHKRIKSTSSARRSRPVSVASDRERAGPSPRISKRFSKRASILPPAALDLLRESPSEPVPKIPEQYKTPTSGNGAFPALTVSRAPSPPPYETKQHPYAARSLKEFEDCQDEYMLFVVRAKEEEGVDGRELSSLIPRLQCAWPSTWEE